jgi:multidrug efflux pump subunit AcrB
MDVLEEAAAETAAILSRYSDLAEVENGAATGRPQLALSLNDQGRNLGLSSADVSGQVRAALFGAEALREQRGRHELTVRVKLPEDQRQSEYDLEELPIRVKGGGFVPLSTVVDLERGESPASITRNGGRRAVSVSAELAPGVDSAQDVTAELQKTVFPQLQEDYPGLQTELSGMAESQAESLSALYQGFALALLVIYALLAIPFKSYTQPLVIMAAIPFGIVGAVFGHLLMGYSLSLVSVFGIIALSGVVINDSLVLVDAINKRRAEGAGLLEAIEEGGARRVRPVLLTSLTTFFGLLPMIFETSVQAAFLIPMAISLGFGVLFATVVVLLLIPVLYALLEELKAPRAVVEESEPMVGKLSLASK